MEVKRVEKLKDIIPRVEKLFYKGSWDEGLFDKSVAIVGSRKMTGYGERVIEKIVPVLVDAGVTIISGFMYGVDQEAHRVCIEHGGKTVAVLGWGIDRELTNGDLSLYKKLVSSGGMMVSEYEGDLPSRPWMFPQRNRIVVGLSSAVIVIEAAYKSGSLITAKLAKKFDKKLLAVPGPITSGVSKGTNILIREGGALMITSGEQVLEALGWGGVEMGEVGQDSEVRGILGLLENEDLMIDVIAKKLGKSVKDIGQELSLLQLMGKVEEKEGRFFVRYS